MQRKIALNRVLGQCVSPRRGERSPLREALVASGVCVIFALMTTSAVAQPLRAPFEPANGGVIDLPMLRGPELPKQLSERTFSDRLKPMWLKAMQQQEASLRRKAINAFAKAHAQGMRDLDDVPARLLNVLRNDADRTVRLAAAQALIAFDHREAADALLQASEEAAGHEMAQAVDSALAQWGHAPARPVWRSRVQNNDASLALRRSAAKALGIAGDAQDVEVLRALVQDKTAPTPLRLDAARAWGRIGESPSLQAARDLIDEGLIGRLLAARMLRADQRDGAVDVLRQLGGDDDPAVAAAALRSLAAGAPTEVLTMRRSIMRRADPGARLALVDALEQVDSDASLATLGRLLGDASRDVRNRSREALVAHGQSEARRRIVTKAVDAALNRSSPAGQAQAALVAGALDHERAAPRLIELVNADDWRVRLACAHALRAVAADGTCTAIRDRLETLMADRADVKNAADVPESWSAEMTQLAMALGRMRCADADNVLRRFVPKRVPFAARTRAAAIWALGFLHADEPDSALAGRLRSRLTDTSMNNPEAEVVRRFSAITLGRMGAQSAVRTCRRVRGNEMTGWTLARACDWAIERLTGDAPPVPETEPRPATGWFLEPISQ